MELYATLSSTGKSIIIDVLEDDTVAAVRNKVLGAYGMETSDQHITLHLDSADGEETLCDLSGDIQSLGLICGQDIHIVLHQQPFTLSSDDVTHPISHLSFSPCGRYLFSVQNCIVQRWSLDIQYSLQSLPHEHSVLGLTVSEDMLYCATFEGICVWSQRSGVYLQIAHLPGQFSCTVYNPSIKWLYALSYNRITLWQNIDSPPTEHIISDTQSIVGTHLVMSDNRLYVASRQGIFAMNPETLKTIHRCDIPAASCVVSEARRVVVVTVMRGLVVLDEALQILASCVCPNAMLKGVSPEAELTVCLPPGSGNRLFVLSKVVSEWDLDSLLPRSLISKPHSVYDTQDITPGCLAASDGLVALCRYNAITVLPSDTVESHFDQNSMKSVQQHIEASLKEKEEEVEGDEGGGMCSVS